MKRTARMLGGGAPPIQGDEPCREERALPWHTPRHRTSIPQNKTDEIVFSCLGMFPKRARRHDKALDGGPASCTVRMYSILQQRIIIDVSMQASTPREVQMRNVKQQILCKHHSAMSTTISCEQGHLLNTLCNTEKQKQGHVETIF